MKKLILLLFVPLISFSSFGQISRYGVEPSKNTLEILGLNGSVKSIITKLYSATEKFGEPEKVELISSMEIKFDSKGNAVLSNELKNGINLKYEYKFDKNGNLIEENSYDAEHFKKSTRFIYDFNGYNIEKSKYIVHLQSEILQSMDKMKYDEFGNILVRNSYSANGELLSSLKYLYHSYSWGKRLDVIETYNHKKELIRKETYEIKTIKQENVCIWNKNDGIGIYGCSSYLFRNFDNEGKTVKVTRRIGGHDTITDYNYINYDKKNNWTTQIIIEDNWVKYVTEREIKYY